MHKLNVFACILNAYKIHLSLAQRGKPIFLCVIVKLFHYIVCKYSFHVKKKKKKEHIKNSNSVGIFVVSLSYIWSGGSVNRKTPPTVLTVI